MRNFEEIHALYLSLLDTTEPPSAGEAIVLDTLQWVIYSDESPELIGRHLLPAS